MDLKVDSKRKEFGFFARDKNGRPVVPISFEVVNLWSRTQKENAEEARGR